MSSGCEQVAIDEPLDEAADVRVDEELKLAVPINGYRGSFRSCEMNGVEQERVAGLGWWDGLHRSICSHFAQEHVLKPDQGFEIGSGLVNFQSGLANLLV